MTLAQRYLAAAGVALLVMPILVLGLGAHIGIALLAAFAIFLGLALYAALRPPAEEAGLLSVKGPGADAARAALKDANQALARIAGVIDALPGNLARERLERIHASGQRIAAEVAEEPSRLAAAQRVLTYYLPRTSEFADSLIELRSRDMGDGARARDITDILAKLEAAFRHYEERLADQDLRMLDTELKLVSEAVREDLGDGRKGRA